MTSQGSKKISEARLEPQLFHVDPYEYQVTDKMKQAVQELVTKYLKAQERKRRGRGRCSGTYFTEEDFVEMEHALALAADVWLKSKKGVAPAKRVVVERLGQIAETASELEELLSGHDDDTVQKEVLRRLQLEEQEGQEISEIIEKNLVTFSLLYQLRRLHQIADKEAKIVARLKTLSSGGFREHQLVLLRGLTEIFWKRGLPATWRTTDDGGALIVHVAVKLAKLLPTEMRPGADALLASLRIVRSEVNRGKKRGQPSKG